MKTRPGNIVEALQALKANLKVWGKSSRELYFCCIDGTLYEKGEEDPFPIMADDFDSDAFQIEIPSVLKLGTGTVRRARYSDEYPDIEMMHVGTVNRDHGEWHLYQANIEACPLSYWDYLGDSNPIWIQEES